MPLSSLDIVFYYSDGATGPSNNTLSLGGTISASTITDALANNIYDDVTGDESSAGDTEYRGIYVKDTNATYTMINTKIWITGYTRHATGTLADTISMGCSTFILGANTMGVCANESSSMNETGIVWVTEGAPSNTIGFSNTSIATTTSPFGATTLAAGSYFGVWFKRIVPAGAGAYSNRSVTIQVQCETTASPYTQTITKEFKVEWSGNNFYVVPIGLL